MAGALANYNGSALMTPTGAYGINNLTPENIKSGVQIGGITGTYKDEETVGAIFNRTISSIENSIATEIPDYAFNFCYGLTSASFSSVATIGSYAFRDCLYLTSVSFPSATSIKGNSFRNCTSLTSIELPLCTSIGSSAFYSCTHLTSMTLGASSVCSLSSTASLPASSSHHMTIYVPSNLISSYQSASNWSTLYSNGYITFQAIS